MRICIFGAGSLGSALGGFLAKSNDVVLIGRRPHVERIRKYGLALVGDKIRSVRLEAVESVKGLEPPDLLIVTTKAFDTERTIRICDSWTTKETEVLTLQNGLGNLELLRKWKGNRAFGGTTTLGARLLSPGKVRISGIGETIIGSDLDPAGAAGLVRTFSQAGIPSKVKEKISREIWMKAVVSSCINPVTALLRIPNGRLVESAVVSRFVREICHECVDVARSEGILLGTSSMNSRVRAVARSTSKNLSSMLQDVSQGKRTEIDQINGAFCRAGAKRGIPTPLNNALVAMVSSLEGERPQQKG